MKPMHLYAVALAALFAAPAYAAGPFESDWSTSAKSRARLIADADGAGLEIALSPGAITYWRDPGEAGVPPSFDFSKSENVAKVEVFFPAPTRIDEPDGSVAFGYRDAVTLPLRVTPADPARPVRLVVHVDYGVCEQICLPARADATLALADKDASPHAAALAQARARVPKEVAPEALGAVASPSGDKAWRLCFAATPREMFLEAPEGFWVEPKREADGRCYGLALKQAPEGGKPPIALRLTVETDRGAQETRVTLGG